MPHWSHPLKSSTQIRYIAYKKFRMTTFQAILPLLEKGAWMVTLDLQDAYFHVSIHPAHRMFLRFAIGKGNFQYKALPFGLSTVPRVFTKVMVVIAAHLHLQGVRVFPYIDWLLVANTETTLHHHITLTFNTLEALGLKVTRWGFPHLPLIWL